MSVVGWAALFAGLPLAVPVPSAGPREALQGTWEVVALVQGGLPAKRAEFEGTRIIVGDDRLTIATPSGGEAALLPGSYACTVGPGLIDLTALDGPARGQVFRGIFELHGGALRTCTPTDPEAPRPRSFEPPPDPPYIFLSLRRVR